MGDFSARWLALREPADHASRSASLARRVGEPLEGRPLLRVLDLGAGTGSNLRYLAPRLRVPQRWLLADRDAELLARVQPPEIPAVDVETSDVDLTDIGGDRVGSLFEHRGLVTASALLDLVSSDWMHWLARRCREAGAAALFVLTYDGRLACTPADATDRVVRELINDHQRGDKGFGPALGPDATACAAQAFAAVGYQIERVRSDWVLGPDAGDLQRELIEGWASAAAEQDGARSVEIAEWRTRRIEHVHAGRSSLLVGHEDLGAWLRG